MKRTISNSLLSAVWFFFAFFISNFLICLELCNHPKSAVFFKLRKVSTFVFKKAMFNLNENNRFVMSYNPIDLRKGVDSLCGAVRSCQLDPLNGDVYVFSNRSRTVLKLLHWEGGGYALYYKRLSKGRFHPKIFLRQGIGFRSIRWDELVLLMEGISPHVCIWVYLKNGIRNTPVT